MLQDHVHKPDLVAADLPTLILVPTYISNKKGTKSGELVSTRAAVSPTNTLPYRKKFRPVTSVHKTSGKTPLSQPTPSAPLVQKAQDTVLDYDAIKKFVGAHSKEFVGKSLPGADQPLSEVSSAV